MKFRRLKLGNIELDIRVDNHWQSVFLAAYEPDHFQASQIGNLVHKVPVNPDLPAEEAFTLALEELNEWLVTNASNFHVHNNPQLSRRSFYEQIRHLCDYGA